MYATSDHLAVLGAGLLFTELIIFRAFKKLWAIQLQVLYWYLWMFFSLIGFRGLYVASEQIYLYHVIFLQV